MLSNEHGTVAGVGKIGDLRECTKSFKQSSREHSDRTSDLDQRRSARGNARREKACRRSHRERFGAFEICTSGNQSKTVARRCH